ncbi:MAG: glutathione S-transferase family protein [Burkholderiaceae bacterium]
MLRLYHAPLSPCAQKVRLVLQEKRLEFDGRLLNLAEKENYRPEYLKLNPKGLVPTLVDGDSVVVESTVIGEYLDDRFPERPLKPVDPYGRARMRLFTKLVDEKWHPAAGALAWPVLVRPAWLSKTADEQQALLGKLLDPVRRARQERLLKDGVQAPEVFESMKVILGCLKEVQAALTQRPWLAGTDYSLADAAVFPYVGMLSSFGMDDLHREHFPAVEDWLDRCRARPSYAAAIVEVVPAARWRTLAEVGADNWRQLKPRVAALV